MNAGTFGKAFAWGLICLLAGAGFNTARSAEPVLTSTRSSQPLPPTSRPRLLITPAQLPEIKKLAQGRYKWIFDGMVERAKAGKGLDHTSYAMLYQITGEAKYAKLAEDMLKAALDAEEKAPANRKLGIADQNAYSNGWRWFFTYDMIRDAMSPEVRDATIKEFTSYTRTRGDNYPNRSGWRVVMALICLYGEDVKGIDFPKDIARAKKWVEEEVAPYFDMKAHDHGGTQENTLTYCTCGIRKYAALYNAWKNCYGSDFFPMDWIYHLYTPSYYVMIPGRERFLVSGAGEFYSQCMYPTGLNRVQVAACASRSPFSQYYVNRWGGVKQWFETKGLQPPKGFEEGYGWMVLAGWYDPDTPEARQEDMPETAYFKSLGWVCMRSSWKDDATFCFFKCGPEYYRDHYDNGHIYIYKHGEGTFEINDEMSQGLGAGLTIGHNTITVYKPDEVLMRWNKDGFKKSFNDGGQCIQDQFALPIPRPYGFYDASSNDYRRKDYASGAISAYETDPLFDYAVGDASNSYHADKVSGFTRQVLYIKPDNFILFDRITAVKPEYKKRWLYQLPCKPDVQGNVYTFDAFQKRFKLMYSGRNVEPPLKVKPGQIQITTFLPAKPEVKFFNGYNSDMGQYYSPYSAFLDRETRKPPEVIEGMWRMEISPPTASASDVFLHTISVCDPNVTPANTFAKFEFSQTDAAATLVFALNGRKVTATFNKTGPVGGRLTMTDAAGKKLVDRDMTQKVLDDYANWKDDPRFKLWTDKPEVWGRLVNVKRGDAGR